MSLDVTKLEKVRELAGGIVQARCPACAEGGHDRTGDHLRIYPDGKFGCCVHPKDGEHRKRIWALAGCKLHLSPAQSINLRLKTPAPLPSLRSVTSALNEFRTPRTAKVKLRACAQEDCAPATIKNEEIQEQLKDSESAVRNVRPLPSKGRGRLPYLTAGGTLVIPMDSPERYHWWKPDGERLTVAEIRAELATPSGGAS